MNPEPPQPHHRLTSCHRHPDQQVTGFCASCLRERLASLDPANSSGSSARLKTPALRGIFKGSGDVKAAGPSSSSALLMPELRRCKSFSGGRLERFCGVVEPQRKSCDVRVRNTLWSLFNLDEEGEGGTNKEVRGEIEIESRELGFSGVGVPVIESREEEEEQQEEKEEEEEQNVAEIRVSDDVIVAPNPANVNLVVEEEEVEVGEMKTMKDHIDLESQSKKPTGRDLKDIAGSFLSAASVFSKKLQKWRRKQKIKKRSSGGESAAMPVKKRAGRQFKFRETQSEIADYGFGRRSCDTDPRFSVDAGRMSFDDPRFSWDEPRASWDGYLIGRMFPRVPQMVSVVEDVNVPVRRSDNRIPVEEPMNSINENETTPGGSSQTKDYYSDSSSSHRRRKSLDRSSSVRKTTAALVTEAEEMKPVSNAKVTPATIDYFHGTKVLVTDRDLRDSKSNSLRDARSESFESAFRDTASVMSGGGRKGSKKSRRWSKGWNIFGFIHGRSGRKNETEERCCRGNVVERSFSESWPELRREVNGDVRGVFNRKAFRSNSSVSSRSSSNMGSGLFGNLRSSETNGQSRKRREDFVMERNRSARYSPSSLDNGLLRFYLTPLRGSRRSNSGKNRPKTSHSIARSMFRLY